MPNFTTFSVLFFVRKHSRDNQKLSIYARITTDGKRSELSLKRSVAVNHWDPSKGRGTTPAIGSLNQYLDHTYTLSFWTVISSFLLKIEFFPQKISR